jgi:hypothetical protein
VAISDDELSMARGSLPEYIVLAELGVARGGVGCPTAMVLFALVDAIGSFHREHPTFTVKVGKQDLGIPHQNDHMRILNAPYFGDPSGLDLNAEQISRLYKLGRSPLTHNAVVAAGCLLVEGSPARPAIEESEGVIYIYLPELLLKCKEAVSRFLNVADAIIPASLAVRELVGREAPYEVQVQRAMARIKALGGGTWPTANVTGIGRP